MSLVHPMKDGYYVPLHQRLPMEVKLFVSNNPQKAEQEMNEWFLHNRIYVQHIGQAQCERNGNLMMVFSIFYYHHNDASDS